MPELSTEDLVRLIKQTRAVAEICERHGELEGRTAAQSQHRALTKEIERLELADAGAGH